MATIKIKNIDRLQKRLDQISKVDIEQAVRDATTFVHGQAKLLAPANTGNLAGSIHMSVKKSDKDIEGKVYTNLQYAPYVEFGTGSKGNGTYPNKNISLSYRDTPWVYTPDGGETFYHTNGQVAQPFMYPALTQGKKYVKEVIGKGLENELKFICKGGQ